MESFTSKTSSLSGKDTAEKLQSSHDRGLIPLMLWLEKLINLFLVRPLSRKYLLTWVGLFPADEERKHERQKLSLTVDEVRAIDGNDPHPDPDIGEAPVNPSLLSIYNMKMQQEMMGMGQGGGFDGMPGSEMPLPYQRDKGLPGAPGGPSAGGGGTRPGLLPSPAAKPALPAPAGPPKPPSMVANPAKPPETSSFRKGRLVVDIRDVPDGDWP